MSKGLSHQERAIRIELARARAALERQQVKVGLCHVRESFTLTGVLQSVLGQRRTRGNSSAMNWLSQGLALSGRYPYVLRSVSALLGTTLGRHRSVVWRAGLVLLGTWRLASRLHQKKRPAESVPDSQTRIP